MIQELNERFVAVKIESAKAPDLARRMNARWLPGLIVAGADERPANVQIGYLDPADLRTELDFGRGLIAMGSKAYAVADAAFSAVTQRSHAERAPDAWYWWGISAYRQSKNFAGCQEHWAKIVARWPESLWTRKVSYALDHKG
mgnify:CR=1 FL=1